MPRNYNHTSDGIRAFSETMIVPSPDLNEPTLRSSGGKSEDLGARERRRRPRRLAVSTSNAAAAAFGLALSIPLVLAFRGGAADVVARQETAAALMWGIALLALFGLLPLARLGTTQWRILAAGGALTAIFGASLFWAESVELAAAEANRVLLYLAVVAFCLLGVTARSWRAAAAGLAIATLTVPVFASLSRLAPEAVERLGADLLSSRRLIYPLGYWNAVAAWSAMALAAGVAYSAHLRAGPGRSLALAATPFAGLALYLTYSRGGMIAAFLGLAVVVAASHSRWIATYHALAAVVSSAAVVLVARSQPEIANGTGDAGGDLVTLVLFAGAGACALYASFTARRRPAKDGRHARLAGAWLATAAVLAGITALLLGARGAGVEEGGLDPGSPAVLGDDPAERLISFDSSRYEIWASALRAFGEDPIGGIGAGSFGFWWGRDASEGESIRNAHSLYLEVAAELGLLGLLALLAFLGGLLAAAVNARRNAASKGEAGAATALLAIYVVFLFSAGIDWMWEISALSAVGIAAAAILGGAGARAVRRSEGAALPGLVLFGVGLAAGAAQIPAVVATERVRASALELDLGNVEQAVEDATDAATAAPWAASPFAQRAAALARAGDFDAARVDALEAIDREPTNWRHHFLLAGIEGGRGRERAALAALAEAQRLSPVSDKVFEEAAAELQGSAGS